jgi:hypothetical protein
MSNRQRKGSAAPMWWGIFFAIAVTAAAVIDYNRVQDPVRDSLVAHTDAAR